jgi:hypothetical protein
MKMELRKLTNLGIEQFDIFLMDRVDNGSFLPKLNLNRSGFSEIMKTPKKILIESERKFNTRLDLGSYLKNKLVMGGVKREDVVVSNPDEWSRVWSWLAYVWFDQFITKRNGIYKVPSVSRFIGSSDFRKYYRHFVSTPYWLYSLHGHKNSQLFLSSPVHIHSEILEQIGSRQWIINSNNLSKLAHRLYWDPENNRSKRGASGKGKGTARRFASVMNQFSLTYDLDSMSLESLLFLLPSEFDKWKK